MDAKECCNLGNRVGTGLVGCLYRGVAEFVPLSDRFQRCCRPVFTHDFRAQRLAIDMIENALHECLATQDPGTLHLVVRVICTDAVSYEPGVRASRRSPLSVKHRQKVIDW